MSNIKISSLDSNISTWAVPPVEGYVAIYNSSTKLFTNMAMEDFQRSFGLGDTNFIVGNYTSGDDVDAKLTVFGDTKLSGGLIVSSASVGTTPSGSFSGLYLGSDLITESIRSALNDSNRVNFTESGIGFFASGEQLFSILEDSVVLNVDENTGFTFKINANREDILNNTLFFVDASESGGVGVGTDQLVADLQVRGKRILLGGELGGVLPTGQTLSSFSALGGKCYADLSIAFQSGTASGSGSFAVNKGIARGTMSFADGFETEANGDYSAAHNNSSIADGDYSHAEGFQTRAIGIASHSEGKDTVSSGDYSHAEGSGTNSSGKASHAEGISTVSFGDGSHAQGKGSKAFGEASHVEGFETEAYGVGAHAEGYKSFASGSGTHAQGYETRVVGNHSSANGYKTNVTGDDSYGNGRECEVSGDSAQAEGLRSEATAHQSFAIGVDALARQTAEHARSAGKKIGVEKSQNSRYFGLQHQSGYDLYTKYPITLAGSGENINLEVGGVYNLDVSLVGKGRILNTARSAGNSVNWNYRLQGNVNIYEGATGQKITSFSGEPYLYTTPMSPIYGSVVPDNAWTPNEPYIVTDDLVVSTPNQYNEIPGFTPYIEIDKDEEELIIGVVRSSPWAHYEVGSLFAGNASGSGQYVLVPSVIFTGKNAAEEDLLFADISGFFNKDEQYFVDNYSGYVLDTGYNISGINESGFVGSIDINYSGAYSLGQSDLFNITDEAVTGFSGLCYGNIDLDCEIYWHSIADLNILVSQIATTGDLIINC